MKAITIVLTTALVAASGFVMAAEPSYDAGREQRMNEALDQYRESQNTSPGPAARAEESIKRGAKKVGHAVGTGVRKTGEALHNVGEKMQGKTADK